MTRDQAIEAINDLVQAEVNVMKDIANLQQTTKKSEKAERRAVEMLFEALTGSEPTDEEVLEMTEI